MNLVEANIKEIKKEKTIIVDGRTYVDVEVVVNMWGSIRTINTKFRFSDWEEAKIKGYFLYQRRGDD